MTTPRFAPSLALLLLLPAFAGCLDSGEPAQPALAASVSMVPGELVGGTFQPVEFTARQPLSLLVPYPVRDSITGLVQNGTVLDFARVFDSQQVMLLAFHHLQVSLPERHFVVARHSRKLLETLALIRSAVLRRDVGRPYSSWYT